MLIKEDIQQVLGDSTYGMYLAKKSSVHSRYKALSDDEFVAIYAYTNEVGKYTYKTLNQQFRQLSISRDFFAIYLKIQSGLHKIQRDKAPDFFYRSTNLKLHDLTKLYNQDFVSLHTFLTSVSSNNTAQITGNVFLRIRRSKSNTSPAYIGGISAFPTEEEYLYDQNTFFFVIAVVDMGQDNYEVHLAELDQ